MTKAEWAVAEERHEMSWDGVQRANHTEPHRSWKFGVCNLSYMQWREFEGLKAERNKNW